MSLFDETALRTLIREEVRAAVTELRQVLTPSHEAAPQLLSVGDVATRCSVTTETVRGWIHSEQLAARRAGHRWLVRPADLERFLAQTPSGHETISDDQHLQMLVRRAEGGRR